MIYAYVGLIFLMYASVGYHSFNMIHNIYAYGIYLVMIYVYIGYPFFECKTLYDLLYMQSPLTCTHVQNVLPILDSILLLLVFMHVQYFLPILDSILLLLVCIIIDVK